MVEADHRVQILLPSLGGQEGGPWFYINTSLHSSTRFGILKNILNCKCYNFYFCQKADNTRIYITFMFIMSIKKIICVHSFSVTELQTFWVEWPFVNILGASLCFTGCSAIALSSNHTVKNSDTVKTVSQGWHRGLSS